MHNTKRRMAYWAEYIHDHFSWPPASELLPTQVTQDEPWIVSLETPSEAEVRNGITVLNSFRAAGPDFLPPAIFKDKREILQSTDLTIPANWRESTTVVTYKKGSRTDCANHRGISLTPVVTKLLTPILVRRLLTERKSRIRKEQAGIHLG
ncbi:unnamed protein product [Dicrocoelium dendriticum]|nr:unnamed protein product [Dicrocoelium dendriticum]